MSDLSKVFLYLLSCAVNCEKPDYNFVKSVDLEKLLKLGQHHSVSPILAYALKDAGFDNSLLKDFEEEKAKSIRKQLLYKNELNEICADLSLMKIWHLPLKGALIMDYYPKIGMRQMADLDIYFDKNYEHSVLEYMLKRGYEAVDMKYEVHNTYQKKPFFNIEFHKVLVSKNNDPRIYNYYSDINRKILTDKADEYKKTFTPEDFYVYTVVHAAKHYFTGGTGIRTFLDIYVYINHYKNTLNFKYITEECKKMGLEDFEKTGRELALKIFSGKKYFLSDQENEMLYYTLENGTYGYSINKIKNKMKKMDNGSGKSVIILKLKYLFTRAFPNVTFMKTRYPILEKFVFFLPIMYIHRLIYKFITHFHILKTELKNLKKI